MSYVLHLFIEMNSVNNIAWCKLIFLYVMLQVVQCCLHRILPQLRRFLRLVQPVQHS